MKKILLLLSIGWYALALQAQDMKSLYAALPDSLSPLLTKVNREDFADFLDSHMKAEVKNRFDRPSEMKQLTPDYLLLQETGSNTIEMKLLPLNDSVKVICVVTTCYAPAADSHLSFYDTGWHPLPASRFVAPPSEDEFYLPAASQAQADSVASLRRFADLYLLKASLSADSRTLSFTYTTPDYIDKKDAAQLRSFIVKQPLRYEWKEGKFVR